MPYGHIVLTWAITSFAACSSFAFLCKSQWFTRVLEVSHETTGEVSTTCTLSFS